MLEGKERHFQGKSFHPLSLDVSILLPFGSMWVVKCKVGRGIELGGNGKYSDEWVPSWDLDQSCSKHILRNRLEELYSPSYVFHGIKTV